MSFKVIGTETYLNQIEKLPNDYKQIAEKFPEKLKENPSKGKLLAPFLREKRIKERRIYYIVYDDLKLVLLVAMSDKKAQQETIDRIKNTLDEYRKIAKEITKQVF